MVWGESKLVKMAWSGSLAPHFLSHVYVTTEIIYSTVHVPHEVLAWSQTTLCCRHIWDPPKNPAAFYGCHDCVYWVSHTSLLLLLLRQPGERLCCVRLCYDCCFGCCISQERKKKNVYEVPMTPQVFFQPLHSHLAYPGFSKQWGQWITRQLVSQIGSAI